MKQNFNTINFYKINVKISPQLYDLFGYSRTVPFVNFYESTGTDGAKPNICGVVDSDRSLANTIENIESMVEKLSGNVKPIRN